MKRLWNDELELRENLQKRLPKLARKYFKEGRKALQEGVSWEEMHQFRLQTKRFRYSLELFRQVYGPGLERRIENLRKVQSFLGDINDAIVTSELLATITDTEALREDLADRATKKTEKLREYWAESFDADGAEEKWTRYLVQFACRPTAQVAQTKAAS